MSQFIKLFDGSVLPDIETLTGNSGGAVGPDGSFNINLLGDTTTINVVGNPATSTLTFSATGAVPIQFDTDSGSAVPALGILNILGGNNIGTTGSGNTVTVDVTGTTDHSLLVGNALGSLSSLGVATNGQLPIGSTGVDPVLATLTAGTGIGITNAAGSITISSPAAASAIQTIDGNTGSATGTTVTVTTGASNANGTINFSATGSTVTFNTTDSYNSVGIGTNALKANAAANARNVAIGQQAMETSTTAAAVTAIGQKAGQNSNATSSTFVGLQSGQGASGDQNDAFGVGSLATNNGPYNVAIGASSLARILTGRLNTCLGNASGYNYTGGESRNIIIGSSVPGTVGESNVLRIANGTGTGDGQVNKAIIGGITGITTGGASNVAVIDSSNQLGTVPGGAVTFNSGTQTMNISSDASATTVNMATGAGAKVVTLGSTNGASSLSLKYGTADMTLASATGTVLSALDTGEITMPLQSAFLAQLASAASNKTGNGTNYTLGTDALTEIFDQNADFNTNGTFTAPVTGRYMLGGQGVLTGCTIAAIFTINITTSNRVMVFAQSRAASSQNFYSTANCFMDMDAGDTFTCVLNATGEVGDTDDVFGAATNIFTGMWGYLSC